MQKPLPPTQIDRTGAAISAPSMAQKSLSTIQLADAKDLIDTCLEHLYPIGRRQREHPADQ